MVFGVVVRKVGSSRHPVDEELSLSDSILDPIKAHINGFGSLLFDGLVGKTHCHGIVNLDWSGWLWVPQFNEGVADGDCFLAIEERGTDLGFRGRGHDVAHDLGEGEKRSIEWRNGKRGDIRVEGCIAEEIMSSCATAGFGFTQVRSIGV